MSGEYKFSAYWKMWTSDGIQVTFGVAEDDAEAHQAALAGTMASLRSQGYLAQLPGLEDGEKVEDVDAYVLGETSRCYPCIYVYSASHQLQYRIAVIYVERFPELPFEVKAKKWEASAAPQREEAERKGFLTAVTPFRIVLEQRGVTDDGKPQWRFSRIHGAALKPPTGNGNGGNGNGNGSNAGSNGGSAASNQEFGNLPSAQDQQTLSNDQRKQILALAKSKFASNDQYIAWLRQSFKTEHIDRLTMRQAGDAIALLKTA